MNGAHGAHAPTTKKVEVGFVLLPQQELVRVPIYNQILKSRRVGSLMTSPIEKMLTLEEKKYSIKQMQFFSK